MNLSDIVAPSDWRILVECDEGGNSELDEVMSGLTDGELAGWLKLLERAAIVGPKNIPRNNRHHIDKPNDIYEFIKGKWRLSFFYDEGNIVVCGHMFRKKTQETPKKDKKKAARLKERYLNAKADGTLTIVE
ncbi:type II toxin-antitoxin system RelE/ParE family toxin [Microbulbifer sp. ARAS458-1]|uniref:type II toxin-antitoxin system RelE/ParE family toxin n=1 Tax=Microbulbifer sp. ARAS458-1 TaxID=3140242 RepID=UPI0038783DFB